MNKAIRGLLWAGAAVAAPAIINAVISARAARRWQSLPGDIAYYDWVYGRVAFYRLGQGPPLLLLHHPGVGGSAWEWRKIFLDLANDHTVYAMDMLGFGLSDKPDIVYSGRMLADLAHDFIEDVIGGQTLAIGSGLGAAYLVNVAVRRPESIGRLVISNPTAITMSGESTANTITGMAMRTPVLGTSYYYTMVSRRIIEQELRDHIYYDPTFVTPDVVEQLYIEAHQPGSQHAATAYLTGGLDMPMRMDFASITQPVLMVWGREAFYTPLGDAADLLYRHPHSKLEILDECGMLPHDERAGEFIRLTRAFLNPPAIEEKAA